MLERLMMGRPRKRNFEERVNELMEEYLPFLDEAQGVKYLLMKDALQDYCCVCVQLEDVKAKVLKTGTTIENVQGNVVKNPDVSTMHQFINEKNALLPKILKHLDGEKGEPADEFVAFMREH